MKCFSDDCPPWCMGVDDNNRCRAIPGLGIIGDRKTCEVCATNGHFGLPLITEISGIPVDPNNPNAMEGVRGLGDVVHAVTSATGIKSAVDWVNHVAEGDCGCKARRKRWNRKWPLIRGSVVIPSRNEDRQEIEDTVASWHDAGAWEIIIVDDGSDTPVEPVEHARIIRNEESVGVAKARNQGARAARGSVVVWSDSHVRMAGSYWKLIQMAARDDVVACAPTQGMGMNPIAWGARLSLTYDMFADKVGMIRRGGFEYYGHNATSFKECEGNRVTACYGSVYAIKRKLLARAGWLPETGIWGYNEQAMSLLFLVLGIPVVVAVESLCRHKYRQPGEMPYQPPHNTSWKNKVMAHRILFTDAEWWGYWRQELLREYPTGEREIDRLANDPAILVAHANHMQARKRFGVPVDHTDIGFPWVRPRVVWAMAVAPKQCPVWERVVTENCKRADEVLVRVDENQLSQGDAERIYKAVDGKGDVFYTNQAWERWRWRQELVNRLKADPPDVVVMLDQDETLPEAFEKFLMRWWCIQPEPSMWFDYTMVTDDGAEVEKYPKDRHCKVWAWHDGVTFKGYRGHACPTSLYDEPRHYPPMKVEHHSHATEDARRNKVEHH